LLLLFKSFFGRVLIVFKPYLYINAFSPPFSYGSRISWFNSVVRRFSAAEDRAMLAFTRLRDQDGCASES